MRKRKKVRRVLCPVCGEQFSGRAAMEHHRRMKHDGVDYAR